jgi:hypothetical protein
MTEDSVVFCKCSWNWASSTTMLIVVHKITQIIGVQSKEDFVGTPASACPLYDTVIPTRWRIGDGVQELGSQTSWEVIWGNFETYSGI